MKKHLLPLLAATASLAMALILVSCSSSTPAEIIPVPVTRVALSSQSMTLNKRDVRALVPMVEPANATNKELRWTSSREDVATVGASGLVTAIKSGTTTITARAVDGGAEGRCDVTVKTPLEGIVITPQTPILRVGEPARAFTATIIPADADPEFQLLRWIVNEGGGIIQQGATYFGTCYVTAREPGYLLTGVTVVAVNGGHTASAPIRVLGPEETGDLVMAKASTTIGVGGTETMAIRSPGSASGSMAAPLLDNNHSIPPILKANSDLPLRWDSSNKAVAVVDEDGVVTGLAVGRTNVTAENTLTGEKTTCQVNVSEAHTNVTGITLNPSRLSLVTASDNMSAQITASIPVGTNKYLIWECSNPGIVRLSGGSGFSEGARTLATNITVSALQAGTTDIVATSENGNKTAVCSVSVRNSDLPIASVNLYSRFNNDANATILKVGGKFRFDMDVVPKDATNQKIKKWVYNSDYLYIDPTTGVIEGIAPTPDGGETPVRVIMEDGYVNDDNCKISFPRGVVVVSRDSAIDNAASVSLTKNKVRMAPGAQMPLAAVVEPASATNKAVVWASTNPGVASVDQDGIVKAHNVGPATITATTIHGVITAVCDVTVSTDEREARVIALSPTSLDLTVGGEGLIRYTLYDKNPPLATDPPDIPTQNVSWRSLDNAVSVVGGFIKVLRQPASTTTNVYAKWESLANSSIFVERSAEIRVPAPTIIIEPDIIELEPNSLGFLLDDGSKTITARVLGPLADGVRPLATDQSVTFVSSATAVVTVTDAGVVSLAATAADGNTAAIIVTSVAKPTVTATCPVTVAADHTPVTSIKIQKGGVETTAETFNAQDQAITLTALVEPTGATTQGVTWEIIDEVPVNSGQDVIVISGSNGTRTFTAKGSGTAKIRVTSQDNKSVPPNMTAECAVTVAIAPQSLSIMPATQGHAWPGGSLTGTHDMKDQVSQVAILPSGADQTLVAGATLLAQLSNVTWSYTGPLGSITPAGIFTSTGDGTAVITATVGTAPNEISGTVNLDITDGEVGVIGVSINPSLPATELDPIDGTVPLTLTAVIDPANATVKAVNWEIVSQFPANTGQQVVNPINLNGNGDGTCTINANASGRAVIRVWSTANPSAEDTITVWVNIPVTSVTVTAGPSPLQFAPGATRNISEFTVQVIPATALQGVRWELEGPDVDANKIAFNPLTGAITATAEGTATLKAISEPYPGVFAPISVDVKYAYGTVNVAGVALSPSGPQAVNVQGPSSLTFTATLTAEGGAPASSITNKTLNWSVAKLTSISSPELDDVISITPGTPDADGTQTVTINGLGAGTATITVTAADNILGTFSQTSGTITVTIPVTAVNVPDARLVAPGGTLDVTTLPVTVVPEVAYPGVTWSVVEPAHQSMLVGNTFTAGAVPDGTQVTLRATTTVDGSTAFGDTVVTIDSGSKPVTGVSITGYTAPLTVLTPITLTAVLNPTDADNQGVSWAIDGTPAPDPGQTTVVSIQDNLNGTCTVTPVGSGTAVIKVTSDDGPFNTVTITVAIPATAVTINGGNTVAPSGTLALQAAVAPSQANQSVTWRVSNDGGTGSTISALGVLTAGATEGTVKVIATAFDGVESAEYEVEVTTGTTPVTGVSLAPTGPQTIDALGGTSTFTVTLAAGGDPIADITNKSVSWTVNTLTSTSVPTTNVVSVSSVDNLDGTHTATVTGLGAGTATITVKTTDGNYEATSGTITVTIPVTAVNITSGDVSMSVTGSHTINTAVTVVPPEANPDVTWDLQEVGTTGAVLGAGNVVTATAAGTIKIRATSTVTNTTFGEVSLEITAAPPSVTGVAITYNGGTNLVGGTIVLSSTGGSVPLNVLVSGSNLTNTTGVDYTGTGVGTVVSFAGNTMAPGTAGTANVTATAVDGGTPVNFTVIVVDSITLNDVTPIRLVKGQTYSVTAATNAPTGSPAAAWVSSATGTLSTTNGTAITALDSGNDVSTATLTASITFVNGALTTTNSRTVTVFAPAITGTPVELDINVNPSIDLGAILAAVLADFTPASITWSGSDGDVNVNTIGEVTATGESTGTTITAIFTVDGGQTVTFSWVISVIDTTSPTNSN